MNFGKLRVMAISLGILAGTLIGSYDRLANSFPLSGMIVGVAIVMPYFMMKLLAKSNQN